MNNVEAYGLESVVAALTRLSDVDGENGRLVFAGHSIEQLAGHVSFEDTMWLLFRGALPTRGDSAFLREALGTARQEAFDRIRHVGDAFTLPDAMDAIRASMAHLTLDAASSSDPLIEATRIVSAVAVFAAAWARSSDPVPPDPTLSHAADYLRMVSSAPATDADVMALDTYLVTVADHGMNASTFAARVVASTASDTVSAVVAALGALKGKLHGGAPGPVLDMLDAIAVPSAARAWLDGALHRGERIMGMGHRVYRVRDPRAYVLERALRELHVAKGPASPISRRLDLARAVENEAASLLEARHPRRPLKANVEFYTAVLLEAVGLPRALFTATFAASRAAGWCAHIDEQRRHGRLIRPSSGYVGPVPSDVEARRA